MENQNNQKEEKTGCWAGATIGALYAFLGPLICLLVAATNMWAFSLFGSTSCGWREDASALAMIAFYFFLPSALPIIGGMCISDPSFALSGSRGGEIFILFVANILIFAGLGYLIQQIGRTCNADPDGLLKEP